MFTFSPFQVKAILPAILGLLVFIGTATFTKDVQATTLSTDLQSLVSQGNDINIQLSAMSLTKDNACSELGAAVTSVNAFITSINTVSGTISPLSVDADSLTALDDLATLSMNTSSVLPVLSADLTALNLTSEMADIVAAMDAMLKLSDDIGVMANRILEMGDKILVMSDNIGTMADRILLTQQIQSTNMAMTQSFILSTQENIVALARTVNSSVYALPLNALKDTVATLIADMNSTPLTESNMSSVLADFQTRISLYLDSVTSLSNTLNTNSSIATHFINSDTLTMLGDLSVANAGLSAALKTYSQNVNTLAPTTNITVLDDSVKSMLQLSADIGEMGTRIVEMGDRINVMADNIGLMSLKIVTTQVLQQENLELTVANIKAAQITTVSVIASYGL
jgi:hypothetical protein